MYKNVQANPEKSQELHNTPVVLCWHEKNFESKKSQQISFRPWRWDVPYRIPSFLLWDAPVCEKHIPKPAANGTILFYPSILMSFHDSMPRFMNFRRVLDLLEFKNEVSQSFAGNQRCPGVWNSFPFLAWDLSMHPRAHIWFFNQFICTRACAGSSNLN